MFADRQRLKRIKKQIFCTEFSLPFISWKSCSLSLPCSLNKPQTGLDMSEIIFFSVASHTSEISQISFCCYCDPLSVQLAHHWSVLIELKVCFFWLQASLLMNIYRIYDIGWNVVVFPGTTWLYYSLGFLMVLFRIACGPCSDMSKATAPDI